MALAQTIAMSPLDGGPGLSVADFNRLASLLNEQTGIKLPPAKRNMLDMRLRGRIRELGFAGHSAYCRHLFTGGALAAELPILIDAVTTNKTDFFREPDHFKLLRERLVPDLLALRRSETAPLLKFWSAASSIGAEAYTLAMVLADMLGGTSRGAFGYAILGTDLSGKVLQQASQAIYPREMVEPVPRSMQDRFLLYPHSKRHGDVVRIAPELRRRTRFQRLNLMDKTYPVDRDVDVVMLRNVLIYFEKSDQEAVVSRLFGHLRPGGFLILGHSEAMIGSGMGLKQIAPGTFRKS